MLKLLFGLNIFIENIYEYIVALQKFVASVV